MKTNTANRVRAVTHEGGLADAHQKSTIELERAVATCLLFENTFYETGNDVAARIAELCKKVKPEFLAALAIKARNDYKLRHVPLFLALQMIRLYPGRSDGLVRNTIETIIQRPDELMELLALYWKDGRCKIARQLKKGLAQAFSKFTSYQFAKWDRENSVKLRDVMFLVHPQTYNKSEMNNAVLKQIAENTLPPADTWEVALSAGSDKRATWERLLKEGKLGYMALLMNLRNMEEAGVDRELVENRLVEGAPRSKALPFRFLSAMRAAPSYGQTLSDAMLSAITMDEIDHARAGKSYGLDGSTILLVDVSASMDYRLSEKGVASRLDAANALAILLREVCKSVRVFTFSTDIKEVANLRGIGLAHAISDSQRHSSTNLAQALKVLQGFDKRAERVIVVTDEQSHDGNVRLWTKHGYVINVAQYKPSLQLDGGWIRINGWSERVVEWMKLEESIGEDSKDDSVEVPSKDR